MKHEIKQRTLTIKEQNIIDRIISEDIDRIKLELVEDNGTCIVIKYPDYKKQLTFGSHWINVYKARPGIQIRTPRFLRSFVGKYFDIYEESVDPEERELFRMKPIGFSINAKKDKKRVAMINPYLSKTQFCIIPKQYVEDYIGDSIAGLRLSFNETTKMNVDEGYLVARITGDKEFGRLSFPIYNYNKQFRTRPLTQLSEFVVGQGKNLSDFSYDKTIDSEKYNCNLIIFKEVEIDE